MRERFLINASFCWCFYMVVAEKDPLLSLKEEFAMIWLYNKYLLELSQISVELKWARSVLAAGEEGNCGGCCKRAVGPRSWWRSTLSGTLAYTRAGKDPSQPYLLSACSVCGKHDRREDQVSHLARVAVVASVENLAWDSKVSVRVLALAVSYCQALWHT